MINLTIDNKNIQAEEGQTLLEVARQNGIPIPTLCYHESLEAQGSCRLCSVEVKDGKKSKVVASCLFPVSEGLVVDTKSEGVMNVRRTVMQLLLAQAPASLPLLAMAEEMGIKPEPRFKKKEDGNKCILCRLCVRTCEQIVGVSAIGLSFRGPDKNVGTPFREPSNICIGCGACAYVCPTGHIEMRTSPSGDVRTIWGRDFKMAACRVCGRYFAPEDQLKYISAKTGVPMDDLMVCSSCR